MDSNWKIIEYVTIKGDFNRIKQAKLRETIQVYLKEANIHIRFVYDVVNFILTRELDEM